MTSLVEPDFAKLTQRQREVLTLLAPRLSNSKLAQLLDVAEATAKVDLAQLRIRLRHWLVLHACPGAPEAGNGVFSGEALPKPSIEAASLKLTKRQREVLSLIDRGRSSKEIARALNIAEATTKIHRAALLRTLGVRNGT